MEIELPPAVILGIKIASGLIAVVVIYRSRKDIVKIWSWVRPAKKPPYTPRTSKIRPHMDAAWRQLIDDSRQRGCEKSINLLNEWIAIRTHDGLRHKTLRHKTVKKKS